MRDKLSRRKAIALAAKSSMGMVLLPSLYANSSAAENKKRQVPILDVLKYNAVGDGITLDTFAIQRAIDDAAKESGGAQVLLPGGHRYLIGALELRSGIDFHIAGNAELLISTNKEHYTTKESYTKEQYNKGEGGSVITANEAHGLTFSGAGVINGRALEFMSHYDKELEWWRPAGWRPKLFQLTGCRDLQIKDITVMQSPTWTLHMIGCEGVLIDNLKIRNNLEIPNCDGIVPDHCRDVEIRNCNITCGDDAIVVKTTQREKDYGPSAHIRVKDCVIETQDSGLVIGAETFQDIYDVRFENCEIKMSSRGLSISHRNEGNIYDIEFNNITFVSCYHSKPWWGRGEAITLTAIPFTPGSKIGKIHDVRFNNIKGKAENSVRVSGTEESRIQNVTFENVDILFDRWTKHQGGLFDNRWTTAYPDIEPHGNPGFLVRFADNVNLNKCNVAWGKNRIDRLVINGERTFQPDFFTYALEAYNVTGLKYTNFTGESAHPERFKAILIH